MVKKRAKTAAKRRGRWVRRVAETSNAMDLPKRIFKGAPSEIARGLKRSALGSRRTKGSKFQSAMSMLNFYLNRGGRGLSATDRRRLERAKVELRKAFGRPPKAA
ncbi:MAG TPA: DUF3175 domain-containing protein [Methylomirabilota bacterium]|jgi:hypothetical protein|nr:DUF3175 domain-containing protein [Methylomirabilota bacterium]